MLSDRDILKLKDKDIVIYPFNEDDLTPLGYNLNPSGFVVSLKSNELVDESDGYYEIQPHDTVLIRTREAVWVSKKIAGTFHSKVGVVSNGFGHISTTLDPNWKGPLLISLNNPTDIVLKLDANKSFVTLILYKLKTPAKKDHDNQSSRIDIVKNLTTEILNNELNESNKALIKKAEQLFIKPDVYEKFTEEVLQLSAESQNSIIKGLKSHNIANIVHVIEYYLLVIFNVVLITLIIIKISYRTINFNIKISIINNIINKVNTGVLLSIFAILIASLQLTHQMKEETR